MNYQDIFDNSSYQSFRNQTGRKHTEEACANNRRAQTGKKHSAETRAKIAAKATGHVPSKEAREKSSKKQIGKIVSEETRAKLRAASKAFKDASISGTGKVKTVMTPQGIMTTTAAAQLYGVENRHIRHWVKTKPNNFYYVQPKLDKEAAVPDTPSLDTVMAAWASQSVKDLV